MPQAQQDILNRYRKTTIIGAGVIGASWTALFLAHGLDVVVNDPRPDVEAFVRDYIHNNLATREALGLPTTNLEAKLRFEADLERAGAGADLVQENGPERIEFKQDLWARISKVVSDKALLLSSSSARPATEQALKCSRPERLLVGHPFNPPHLIPLVEVVPGEKTSEDAIADAVAFYTALGKVPRIVRKEMPGFVAKPLAARDLPRVLLSRDPRRREGRRTRRHRHQFDRPALGGRRAVPVVPPRWRCRRLQIILQAVRPRPQRGLEEHGAGGPERSSPGQDHRASGSILRRAPGGEVGERTRRQAARDHSGAEIG